MRHLPNIKMDGQVAILAVAAKGSFEAAGKYLGIGKSAVRKRVQSVEGELGTAVFRTVGKRMAPTKAGHLYLPSARESVRQAALGVGRVQAFVKAQRNDLRIGYSSFLNTRLLDIVRRIQPEVVGSLSVKRESMTTRQAIARQIGSPICPGIVKRFAHPLGPRVKAAADTAWAAAALTRGQVGLRSHHPEQVG
jgi:hypothetical protein